MKEHELDEICYCNDYLLNDMEDSWKQAIKENKKIGNHGILISLDDIPILINDIRQMRNYLLERT